MIMFGTFISLVHVQDMMGQLTVCKVAASVLDYLEAGVSIRADVQQSSSSLRRLGNGAAG